MANKKINVDALCPFFITEAGKSITCEGIIGKEVLNRFDTQEEKIAHEEKYCTKYSCEECGIYKANIEKYKQQEKTRKGITEKYSYKVP